MEPRVEETHELHVGIAAFSIGWLSAPSWAAEWSLSRRSSGHLLDAKCQRTLALENHIDSQDLRVVFSASFGYLRGLTAKPGRATTRLGGGARGCEII